MIGRTIFEPSEERKEYRMRALLTATVLLLYALASTAASSDKSKQKVVLHDPAKTVVGHSPPQQADPAARGLSSRPTAPLIGTSLRWFGFYDPVTGVAIEGDSWSFDHGAADPMEGWRANVFADNDFTAWRRITPGTWGGHGNVPSAPVIAGSASVWLGFFEDEAICREFKAGLGYGDDWCQQLRTPSFSDPSGAGVDIYFDYFYDMELNFDFVTVFLEQGGTKTPIIQFTGKAGSPASPLGFGQLIIPDPDDPFNILFEFTTDGSYSDEDSSYATDLGAFGLDNVDLVGGELVPLGPAPPYDFESGMQGFVPEPCPSGLTLAGVNDVSAYTIPDATCGLSSKVVEFHDALFQHPAQQDESIESPPVALPGSGGPFNIFAEYDVYSDVIGGGIVAWSWRWSYYPVVCPVSQDSVWSVPAGANLFFASFDPECSQYRTFATDTTEVSPPISGGAELFVPDTADSVRLYFRVVDINGTGATMFSPLFDNIRIGVSSRTTILHVPSPSYPTIQSAIDASGVGDTVLVKAGTYTGPGNKDLNFFGKNLVLMSEQGPQFTVVDCEGVGVGITFDGGQDSTSVVDGFTFRNGDGAGLDGGGVLVMGASSPEFRNCVIDSSMAMKGGGIAVFDASPTFTNCDIEDNSAADLGGGVYIEIASPKFTNCNIEDNSSTVMGGGVHIRNGNAEFTGCQFDSNSTAFNNGGGVVVEFGNPSFTSCYVSHNSAPTNGGGVYVIGGNPVFTNGDIDNNMATDGAGVYISDTAAATFTGVDIASNAASDDGGAVLVAGGNPTFDGCHLFTNTASDDGGAVVVSDGTPSFVACDIRRNSGSDWGGGVFVFGGTPMFDGCAIVGNSSSNLGGGVWILYLANPTFENCVISGNQAPSNGGGVWAAVGTGNKPQFSSCTITANHSTGGSGGGMYIENYTGAIDTIPITQTIVWDNCAGSLGDEIHVYSVVAGSGVAFTCSDVDTTGVSVIAPAIVTYVSNNVFEDPLFCGADTCNNAPTTAGDYSLAANSPCAPAYSPCGALIGALAVACPSIGTGIGEDVPTVLTHWRLYQNWPNPFNPTTTIRFDIVRTSHVSLCVYDVSGRMVRSLVDGKLPRASHVVDWDGRDDRGRPVASGVYFYRLHADDFAMTKKMVFLK
jgi:hypothetical protein